MITFTRTLPASPEVVFQHLTTPALQKAWQCDDAVNSGRIGGNYFAGWNNGHYVVGTYTAFEANQHLALTWLARGMTQETQVEVDLKADGDCTVINVRHSGVETRHETLVNEQWERALKSLHYVLETGLDYNVMRKPILGIRPGAEPTQERLDSLNLPVTEGYLVTGLGPGLAAETGGIKVNDFIVRVAGQPVKDFGTLYQAIEPYEGGDRVEIEFYRDGQKQSMALTLGTRPIPDWPLNLAGIRLRLEGEFAVLDRELDEIIATTSNDEMNKRPAPNEWSGNEILAHIIWSERWLHQGYWHYESHLDGLMFPGNPPSQRAAILSVHPTTDSLVSEIKRAEVSTLAMLEVMNPKMAKVFVSHIAISEPSMIRHTRNHYKQLRETLEAVRQTATV